MAPQTFAARLNKVLTNHGVPRRGRGTLLAEMLNVDASGVRRWLSGRREPTLREPYIDKMAAKLAFSEAETHALYSALRQSKELQEKINGVSSKLDGNGDDSSDQDSWYADREYGSDEIALLYLNSEQLRLGKKFDMLISQDTTGEASIEYFNAQKLLFWSGSNFHEMADELTWFETFLFRHRLDREPRGNRWLVAISALRGDLFTHLLTTHDLRTVPKLGISEIEKARSMYLDVSSPLEPYLLNAWASVLRKAGEAAGKNREDLLLPALRYQQQALEQLSPTDPARVTQCAGLMASAAGIELFLPTVASSALGTGTSPLDYLQQGRNEAARLGGRALLFEPILKEFQVRWGMRALVMGHNTPLANDFDEIMTHIETTERLAAAQHGQAGVVSMNLAVDKVNWHRIVKIQPPTDLQSQASQLVRKAGSSEQDERLKGYGRSYTLP